MSGAVTHGGPWTVWRWEVSIVDGSTVALPASAKVINVGIDGKTPYAHVSIWVLVPVNEEGDMLRAIPRRFFIYGTGQPIPAKRRHVGTAIDGPPMLVWHVFEEERT